MKRSFIISVILLFASNTASVASVEPDISGCTLEVKSKVLHPTRVIPIGRGGKHIGDWIVTMDENRVSAIRITDGRPAWQANIPAGKYLQLIATGHDILFFQQWEKSKDKEHGSQDYRLADEGRLHRLQLKDGTWLLPLEIGKPSSGDKHTMIVYVEPTSDDLFVLEVVPGKPDLHESQIESYRVSCFTGNETKPRWQKECKSAGSVPSVGMGVLFAGDPLYVKSALKMLQMAGKDLIVCSGAAEDILALEAGTGKEKWRLPAVWEYQRGFIGPSVWEHFIERFGVNPSDMPEDKNIQDEDYRREVHALKKRVQELHKSLANSCKIVGGPIVTAVPLDSDDPPDTNREYRLFVAVSKGTGEFAGYLSDCIVYEIGMDGEPISMMNMPRMVLGNECHVHDDGVIWRCEEGTVAKLTPIKETFAMGPFQKNDRISRLEWFVHPQTLNSSNSPMITNGKMAWLTWAEAVDAAAFDKSSLLHLTCGGYIQAATDRVLRFPIAKTKLPANDTLNITLCVPFKGKAEQPDTNYIGSADAMYSFQPLFMSVVGLEATGKLLIVTVASEDQKQAMLFFELDP